MKRSKNLILKGFTLTSLVLVTACGSSSNDDAVQNSGSGIGTGTSQICGNTGLATVGFIGPVQESLLNITGQLQAGGGGSGFEWNANNNLGDQLRLNTNLLNQGGFGGGVQANGSIQLSQATVQDIYYTLGMGGYGGGYPGFPGGGYPGGYQNPCIQVNSVYLNLSKSGGEGQPNNVFGTIYITVQGIQYDIWF